MNGIEALLEMLASAGVRYIFGNPGTTELPLNDALVADDRFRYILGLQEVAVMGMADGYAMQSHSPGVVNLHVSCGLGHALGILYNAYREGTPLIVTAGQQDRRLQFEEPILQGDLVSVARPWTKWACEVHRVQDIPIAVRRAVQAAMTPPTGPVFLSLPIDVQLEVCAHFDLAPIQLPDPHVAPPPGALDAAAELLLAARSPVILAGSRIREQGATSELIALAEALGAPVISEAGTTHGRLVFPSDHPLYGQGLPLWSPEVRARLNEYDVVLAVGMDVFRQYMYHEPSRALPEHIRLIHIDEDPWQLNKNYACAVAVLGHCRVALAGLTQRLLARVSPAQRSANQSRAAQLAAAHSAARDALRAKVAAQRSARPMTPLALMGTLAEVVPRDVIVIEEAVTTTNTTLERLGALTKDADCYGHRGWALGWGLGVAIGAKLAEPHRPVLALLGDGSAAYGMQGLWSAARYQVPVTFVICNNAQYQILKIGAKGLNLPHAAQGKFESLDIVGPEVDYVKLAESMGVEAVRIDDPDALRDCVRQSFRRDRPLLIDVPVARETPGRLNYG